MRFLVVIVFVAAIVTLTLQAFAEPPAIGDANTARPGGVYVSLAAEDAVACSRLCAQDDICMAWTYREKPAQACELKAVVTPAIAEEGAISGLSRRAPDFARRLAEATAPTPPEGPPAPPSIAMTPVSTRHDASEGLLGGPDDSTLRSRTPE